MELCRTSELSQGFIASEKTFMHKQTVYLAHQNVRVVCKWLWKIISNRIPKGDGKVTQIFWREAKFQGSISLHFRRNTIHVGASPQAISQQNGLWSVVVCSQRIAYILVSVTYYNNLWEEARWIALNHFSEGMILWVSMKIYLGYMLLWWILPNSYTE